MGFKERAIKNQLAHQGIQFHNCGRFALLAGVIKRFVAEEPVVVDAGGGEGLLGEHFKNYVNWDLLDGHDVEDLIPSGDVVVFSHVLEHVTDLKKTLGNVEAGYVLVAVPLERGFPPSIDHVRRMDWHVIREMTGWELVGKWCWVFKPKWWRVRKLFGVSAFAEEEITLWKT